MRFGIVTGLWGRSRLSRCVLRYYGEMKIPGVEFVRVAVWSPEDGEAEDMYVVPGWSFATHPNQPYTDKFNRGFRALRGRVDCAMVVGSDDLVSRAYVEEAARLVQDGVDYLQPQGLHFYDAATGRCIYGPVTRIGAARVLSSRLLDALGWRPYQAGLSRGLDRSMENRVHEIVMPYRMPMVEGRVLMDVKTAHNIWSFDHMEHLGVEEHDGEQILREHFANVADDILAMREDAGVLS